MSEPLTKRGFLRAAGRRLLDVADRSPSQVDAARDDVPWLAVLPPFEVRTMFRSRDRIMANLDEMYREAFERAKAEDDQPQMVSLDAAYRREQLYFEVLSDIRDAIERR
jgi:hypothetical protein